MTDERNQAEKILDKNLLELREAGFKLPLKYGVVFNKYMDAMLEFASLKVTEVTKEIKFPTHDEINKAAMIFDKQKRPLWKEAIYRAGANWAIDWIKQNISK